MDVCHRERASDGSVHVTSESQAFEPIARPSPVLSDGRFRILVRHERAESVSLIEIEHELVLVGYRGEGLPGNHVEGRPEAGQTVEGDDGECDLPAL
jgi:hypothetical protein